MRRPCAEAGFTLTEMMVALAILLIGFTSLLAALTGGVSLRREADARQAASLLAEEVLHRVRQQAFAQGEDGSSVLENAPQAQSGTAEQFPGMRWEVAFGAAPERPDLVLATVTVRWLDQGEFVMQEFRRLLPRQEPLGVRVRRFRAENGGPR